MITKEKLLELVNERVKEYKAQRSLRTVIGKKVYSDRIVLSDKLFNWAKSWFDSEANTVCEKNMRSKHNSFILSKNIDRMTDVRDAKRKKVSVKYNSKCDMSYSILG